MHPIDHLYTVVLSVCYFDEIITYKLLHKSLFQETVFFLVSFGRQVSDGFYYCDLSLYLTVFNLLTRRGIFPM